MSLPNILIEIQEHRHLISLVLTSNDFFRVDLRVLRAGATVTGVGAAFLLDRVRRVPSNFFLFHSIRIFGCICMCCYLYIFIQFVRNFRYRVRRVSNSYLFCFSNLSATQAKKMIEMFVEKVIEMFSI